MHVPTPIHMHTEVIDAAANAAFIASHGGKDELPAQGTRQVDIWSVCFQGGTFERIQERASGDFSLTKQTKYIAQLPALPERIVDERLPRLGRVSTG